ncbi:hypothetical protein DFQ27_005273 [Actinomortierella ambigua]|uniref:Uncharacterized protein n=1 Tax=Actinomortierella ambigua TaxID=1343610 RepID=A0A9P6U344_9FUNG|nr:hypothetical protein DFQ27_005273 [Actinomortierella ambigua]
MRPTLRQQPRREKEWQGAVAVVATSSSNSGIAKPLGQRRGVLVPLSELNLTLLDAIPCRQDALYAFGTTPQPLTINDCYNPIDIDLCEFRDMPALRHLSLSAHLVKAVVAPFSGCPRLTEIYLKSVSCIHNDQVGFVRRDLAQVHILPLKGKVCDQFNQVTLREMPILETLIMFDVIKSFTSGGVSSTWDRSSWGPFPRLEPLGLSGWMTTSFCWYKRTESLCWSMLEQRPAVENLLLEATEKNAFERPTSPLATYPALRLPRLYGYSILRNGRS